MNVNKIDICNMALALIGADIICETGEPSKEARASAIFYENVKNKALAKYDWPFASKTSKLVMLKSQETDGLNRFQLPIDCLIPRELLNASPADTFAIQSDVILTNLKEAVLRYTFSSEETYVFPPDFIDGLVYLMASDMAVFLTDSPQAAQIFASAAETKLENASASLALFKAKGDSPMPITHKYAGISERFSNI